MNDNERIQLQKMIAANDVTDQTELIRQLKHSTVIYNEVVEMIEMKKKFSKILKKDPERFDHLCASKCSFLYNHYTDIYNKVKKDEIDYNILFQFLVVLRKIENNELDQHEGSFEVGKILKELYVDSALRRAGKLEAAANEKESEISKPSVVAKNISWKQWSNEKK